mmetsp:Transcript_17586/g.39782  ORF Transcript_17586/g.39782 Transcript_17586/m.39782 type:complete len:156 (+) Transcript_17586:3863-4330(+)
MYGVIDRNKVARLLKVGYIKSLALERGRGVSEGSMIVQNLIGLLEKKSPSINESSRFYKWKALIAFQLPQNLKKEHLMGAKYVIPMKNVPNLDLRKEFWAKSEMSTESVQWYYCNYVRMQQAKSNVVVICMPNEALCTNYSIFVVHKIYLLINQL